MAFFKLNRMQVLIGIIAAFALLATLIYIKIDFGKAILVATTVLLLISEPSTEGLSWVAEITFEYDTLSLAAIIIQIAFLGFLYKDSEQVMRMIEGLKALFPDRRMVVASIPALFGLMPMPGGALVSAPMIEDEADALDLDGLEKTFLNWWWRHIWFTVYPLSAGLIFAARLSGVSIYRIALFNLPIFATQIMIGIFFGLKKIKVKNFSSSRANPFRIPYELLPIIIALSFNIIFGIPLYITLFLAIITIFLQNFEKYTARNIPLAFRRGFSFDLLLAAYGIMLFKGIIERAESLEPVIVAIEGHVPLLVVVIVASYLIGVLFGHLPGAIGVSFPVLLPLLPVVNVRTVSLMFVFVFMGYFTSPIHLCIILTIEYFGIEMKSFYRRMLRPFSILIVAILIWLFLSGAFFPFF